MQPTTRVGNDAIPSGGSEVQAIVARQGIYDARASLFGYELLFRPASPTGVQLSDADAATAEVVLSAFTDIGMARLVGGRVAFINIPYRFLSFGYCESLPTDGVVLEILEDVRVDATVLDRARGLVRRGHRLALDDFVYRPGLEPLMELAEYVKLDVLALSEQQLFEHIELVHHYGAKLVAEKVESLEQVEDLRDLGVELFQGFALARPVSVRASAKRVNRVVVLELLAKLQDPEAEIGDQVDTIARDPDIAYALLRILNSGYFSFVSPIDSIHQAVVMLGADGLRNWVTMMVMTRLAPHAHELTSGAFIRAKMCELCAQRTRAADPAIAFSAGLFSIFPELLDMTMPVIARQLGLGPELTTAIVELRGPIGHILDCVLAYENQDQRHLADRSAPPEMINAFLDAARWSTETMAVLTTT